MRSSLVALFVFTACASEPATEAPPPEEETSGGEEASSISPEPPAPSGPVCESTGFMQVTLAPGAYETRRGLGATRFSELETSQQKPLEECGLENVLRRLATLQCDDGSNPFGGNMGAAHASRAGNTGPGGRCGSIIDLYQAACPEGPYEVYADMYFCPSGP